MAGYRGPLRAEPLAIELHNTLYADRGRLLDGLEDPASAAAFVDAVAARLPDAPDGSAPAAADLSALREAVRSVLSSIVEGRALETAAVAALNDVSARAATSPALAVGPGRAGAARDELPRRKPRRGRPGGVRTKRDPARHRPGAQRACRPAARRGACSSTSAIIPVGSGAPTRAGTAHARRDTIAAAIDRGSSGPPRRRAEPGGLESWQVRRERALEAHHRIDHRVVHGWPAL